MTWASFLDGLVRWLCKSYPPNGILMRRKSLRFGRKLETSLRSFSALVGVILGNNRISTERTYSVFPQLNVSHKTGKIYRL